MDYLFIRQSRSNNMQINETLMTKAFSVMNPDPYLLALRVMEEVARTEKVVEKKNAYETDGPHHRCFVNFDAVELIDDFSKIVFNFDLQGENGMLRVNVNGLLDLEIEETGFFSEAFGDHYTKNIFPLLRKMSEKKIEFFGKTIDDVFSENN